MKLKDEFETVSLSTSCSPTWSAFLGCFHSSACATGMCALSSAGGVEEALSMLAGEMVPVEQPDIRIGVRIPKV
jgi:hypothetical protein